MSALLSKICLTTQVTNQMYEKDYDLFACAVGECRERVMRFLCNYNLCLSMSFLTYFSSNGENAFSVYAVLKVNVTATADSNSDHLNR